MMLMSYLYLLLFCFDFFILFSQRLLIVIRMKLGHELFEIMEQDFFIASVANRRATQEKSGIHHGDAGMLDSKPEAVRRYDARVGIVADDERVVDENNRKERQTGGII